MKNFFAYLLAGLLMTVPATAFAAMPDFRGTGYQVGNCAADTGHPIYEFVFGVMQVTGCTPDSDWQRAEADAARIQGSGYHFGIGQSLALKAGGRTECFWWFIADAGCVVDGDLVVR